ncbi:MAG: chemotaxis response regulator protein-glutamate methylesterase [Chloroflexi bacterium]|nr:chemotaxis response regulator protein-glutamate methylesterase [Chloroflexota bacterium]
MIKVLVVDDSAYMRYVLRTNLDADPDITVVDTARDGLDALAKIAALKPEVITLDLEMPRMDGFAALKRIMAEFGLPVIILSSLSQEGADATIKALRLGAADFVPKPAAGGMGFQDIRAELLSKIKGVRGLNTSKLQVTEHMVAPRSRSAVKMQARACNGVVVIGTSTGGPRALHEVVPHLPASLPLGVLIVQHMPPGFTKSLSQRLDEVSALTVKEAEQGDIVQAGVALLAPGNYHMTVVKNGTISLDQEPPRHGVRPSVDATMESVAQVYGPASLGVILTGMGCDGTQGAKAIKEAGGHIIAEDESSCVIYGMPRSAVEAGVVDRIAPLVRVPGEIVALTDVRRSFRTVAAS